LRRLVISLTIIMAVLNIRSIVFILLVVTSFPTVRMVPSLIFVWKRTRY
jgi:hypothetical protein